MAKIGSINDIVNIQLARNQFASMSALVLISEALARRMKEEEPKQAVNFDRPEIVRARREQARLTNFRSKVVDSAIVLSKASSAIDTVATTLTSMRNDLLAINSETTAGERGIKLVAFNDFLKKIEATVAGAGQTMNFGTVNLIGDPAGSEFKTDNLSTAFNPKSGVFFVEGTYLGTDYLIEDADGFFWRRDDNGQNYVQMDANNNPTGSQIAIAGLTLTSFDADTGAISFGGDEPLSGTVRRGGLGILTGDLYNDFADDAAVARAVADIDTAIRYVTSRGANIKAKNALIDGNLDIVAERIKNLEKDVQRLIDHELSESSARSRAAKAKLGFAVRNINIVSSANLGLLENMVLMMSGPQKAGGLFGMMGF